MTPQEFKAWFDGFTEFLQGPPNEDQWARIKARVAEIDGTPVTYPIYVHRYIEPARPYWPYTVYSTGSLSVYNESNSTPTAAFDSIVAMNNLGRAEAMSCVG